MKEKVMMGSANTKADRPTKKRRVKNKPITIGGVEVLPGERKTIDLKVGKLYTHGELNMPVQVWCGRQSGPVLFVSAAVHGDELNGVEIIRRLLKIKTLQRLKGTLVTVPIVNLHGFINHSRYLPDRRDLNRNFPGSKTGSIASRLAHVFLTEIVSKATHGIDLHTGAINRSNLPQIRANLNDATTLELAHAFGAPIMLNSNLRDGSLRAAAVKRGIPILLYEAGEALRFDEVSIRAGVRGIVNVMRSLKMLPPLKNQDKSGKAMVAKGSYWIRATQSGIFRSLVKDGERVKANQTLVGVISDPFGEVEKEVYAPHSGIVIGQMCLPLVNEGEALFHIARTMRTDLAMEKLEEFHEELTNETNLPYPTEDIPSL